MYVTLNILKWDDAQSDHEVGSQDTMLTQWSRHDSKLFHLGLQSSALISVKAVNSSEGRSGGWAGGWTFHTVSHAPWTPNVSSVSSLLREGERSCGDNRGLGTCLSLCPLLFKGFRIKMQCDEDITDSKQGYELHWSERDFRLKRMFDFQTSLSSE